MFRTDEVDLRHYGLILRRWKRVILGAVGVCVALAVIFNVVTVPAYQATTRLEVRKEPSRSALTGAETGADDWHSDNVTLFTAAELITSRGLMRDVVETLRAKGLLRIDPPRAQAWRRLTAWFAAIGAARSAPAGATGAQEPEIDWLLSILKVTPIRDQLRRDLLQRETDLARAREVYKDKHPKLVMLESERQSIRDNIRSELSKTASTLKGDYSMLDQREGSLRGAIAQAEEELRQVNAELGRTTTVESEAKSDKDLYALLSSKEQEVQISGKVGP